MGEIIDLDAKRKEKWIAKIERMRDLGEVAVFGTIGEVNADIIEFRRRQDGRDERSE